MSNVNHRNVIQKIQSYFICLDKMQCSYLLSWTKFLKFIFMNVIDY